MDNSTNKIKEIIKGFDEEITSYEKAIVTADEHAKFLKGNVAGLRRAKETLQIYFKNQLEGNHNG
jgi:argonaute-like protein implicated in RNA metabolism and viral defense